MPGEADGISSCQCSPSFPSPPVFFYPDFNLIDFLNPFPPAEPTLGIVDDFQGSLEPLEFLTVFICLT